MLATIKEDADKFGQVISKTLDVDVLIIDRNRKPVSNTFRYFDRFTNIQPISVIGSVIETGKVVSVRNRQQFDSCRLCPNYESCEMVGFIGVPIRYMDTVVGAIALVLPEHRVDRIFENEASSIEFMENMADLLASKLRNHDEYTALDVIRRERELLIDTVDGGIAATDNVGRVTYYNRRFESLFEIDEDPKGKFIWDVVPHPLINELWLDSLQVNNRPILVQLREQTFYGLLSCKEITIKGTLNGMFFMFKPISSMRTEITEIGYQNMLVSFSWENQRLFSESVEDRSKRLAVTDKPLLIQGEPGTGQYLMAKCIHKFSNRAETPLLTVNCSRLYRDLQDELIFGDFGKLHLANKGTILFRDVDQLPMFLQEKLAKFVKEHTLYSTSGGFSILLDVRLLFSSQLDLAQRVQQGLFSDELFYRISQNTVSLTPLRERRAQLPNVLRSGLEFYAARQGKSGMLFSEEALRILTDYPWPGNMLELEQVVEQLALHGGTVITEDDVQAFRQKKAQTVQSLSELERDRIAELLKTNHSKDSVAQMLGISRATLYRRIKNYNL